MCGWFSSEAAIATGAGDEGATAENEPALPEPATASEMVDAAQHTPPAHTHPRTQDGPDDTPRTYSRFHSRARAHSRSRVHSRSYHRVVYTPDLGLASSVDNRTVTSVDRFGKRADTVDSPGKSWDTDESATATVVENATAAGMYAYSAAATPSANTGGAKSSHQEVSSPRRGGAWGWWTPYSASWTSSSDSTTRKLDSGWISSRQRW